MTINYRGIERYGPLQESDKGIWTTTIDHSFHFDESESPVDIMADSNVPAKNSQHPSGNGLYALNRTVSSAQEGDEQRSGKYIVTVNYTNDLRIDSTIDGSQTEVVPWKLPPYDISIFPVEVTKSMVKSYQDGDTKDGPSVPVQNVIGDPIDAQTVEQHTIYSFSYNLRSFNDDWIDTYSDSVNTGSVVVIDNTIPARKGRIRSLGATFQRIYKEDGSILYKYWKVSVEIEKSPTIWQVELMNVGFWVEIAGVRYRIYTDSINGGFGSKAGLIAAGGVADDIVAVDTPQKLSADGSAVLTGTTANYITFNNKFTTNWKPLSLPKTISGQTTTRKGLL